MDLEQFRPIAGAAPSVFLHFPNISGGQTSPISDTPIEVWFAEMKGFMNNGYAIRVQILNLNFQVLKKLMSNTPEPDSYLARCRQEPIPIDIIFDQGGDTVEGRTKTKRIRAIISTVYSHGADAMDIVEIIAIDPVNWALRIGDAEGKAFRGNLSSAISQVIKRYAPSVNLKIDKSIDNPKGVWWSLRRPPKDMLSHWISIASSLNESQTPWMIGIDGFDVKIGPQTSFESKIQGWYRKYSDSSYGEIRQHHAILNPSIGHHEMGIITAGVSATTGKHLDQVTDKKYSIVTDQNTSRKYVPKSTSKFYRSTIRPEQETFKAECFGRSYIESQPEYYSGGEIGINYNEYYDAYARTEYMRHIYKLFTLDIVIPGHGIWDSTTQLGSATVFLDWRNVILGDSTEVYYLHGHWLVYGFKHMYTNENGWITNLQLARTDENAIGTLVPK